MLGNDPMERAESLYRLLRLGTDRVKAPSCDPSLSQ